MLTTIEIKSDMVV